MIIFILFSPPSPKNILELFSIIITKALPSDVAIARQMLLVKQKDIYTQKKLSDKFSFFSSLIVLGIFIHLVNIGCSTIMTLCQTGTKYLSKLLSNLKNSGVDVSFCIHFCSSGFRMIISNFSGIFMHFNCSPTVALCQTKPKYFTRLFISICQ